MFITGVWVWLSALSEEVHVPHPILPDPSDSLLKVFIELFPHNDMPGPVMPAKWYYDNGYKGIEKARKKGWYYIRLQTGRKVLVNGGQTIWHRGRGRYSIYTGRMDRKIRATHRMKNRKKWSRYSQAYDRTGRYKT